MSTLIISDSYHIYCPTVCSPAHYGGYSVHSSRLRFYARTIWKGKRPVDLHNVDYLSLYFSQRPQDRGVFHRKCLLKIFRSY